MTSISPSADATEKPLLWSRTAVVVGSLLLVGLLILLAFAVWDRGRRSELETTAEVTAVGDSDFFVRPASDALAGTRVRFRGEEFGFASSKTIEIRDSRMQRVGQEDTCACSVYTPREPVKLDQGGLLKAGEGLFVKVGSEEYLRLQPVKPGK